MPIDGARGEAASGLQGRFLEKRRHQKLLIPRKIFTAPLWRAAERDFSFAPMAVVERQDDAS
jgi:hypothetical protein